MEIFYYSHEKNGGDLILLLACVLKALTSLSLFVSLPCLSHYRRYSRSDDENECRSRSCWTSLGFLEVTETRVAGRNLGWLANRGTGQWVHGKCCYLLNTIPQFHILRKYDQNLHLAAFQVVGVCGRQEGAEGIPQEVQALLDQGNSRLARFPEMLDAPPPRRRHRRRGSRLEIRCRDRGRSGFPLRPPSGGRGR